MGGGVGALRSGQEDELIVEVLPRDALSAAHAGLLALTLRVWVLGAVRTTACSWGATAGRAGAAWVAEVTPKSVTEEAKGAGPPVAADAHGTVGGTVQIEERVRVKANVCFDVQGVRRPSACHLSTETKMPHREVVELPT